MKPLKLLLIDDDPDDQEIFTETVKKLPGKIECFTALNGQLGIDKLLNEELHPDLIFLDLNMPVMNGWQFLSEFRKHPSLRKIPIVVLSTTISRTEIPEDITIKEFLTKPDTMSDWQEKIGETLRFARTL